MSRRVEPNPSGVRAAVWWLISVAAIWAATAWLARRPTPWAIEMTDPLFALALAWTYAGAWGVAIVSLRRPRVWLFRAVALTLSALAGLISLEAPALAGAVDYGRLRQTLAAGWNEPQANFIEDREFSFRRPSNAHWSGRPRSDMAQYFRLSVRSSHEQSFTTDSRGFRQRDHARAGRRRTRWRFVRRRGVRF